MSTPAPVAEESTPAAAAAVQEDKTASAGPPGFPKRASNTSASRPQSEGVVMPGSGGAAERPIDVQFGSLSLFEGQGQFGQQTEQPKQQEGQGQR